MERGHLQFFVEVHTITETITYKIQSRLWNGILSAPNISIRGSLDKLSIVREELDQANRVWLLFQKKLGGSRVL